MANPQNPSKSMFHNLRWVHSILFVMNLIQTILLINTKFYPISMIWYTCMITRGKQAAIISIDEFFLKYAGKNFSRVHGT